MEITENTQNVNEESTTGLGHNGGPQLDDDVTYADRSGFICVGRSMRNHWLVGFGSEGRHSKAEAWQDLIMECRYAEATVNNNGRPMKLKRGQLLGAVSWLAERWNWTPKEVRGFLDKLEDEGMITQAHGESVDKSQPETEANLASSKPVNKKGRFAKVLTISKYEIYQLGRNWKGQVEGQVQGKLRAGSGQVQGNNLIKERKEEDKKEIKPYMGKFISLSADEVTELMSNHGELVFPSALVAADAYLAKNSKDAFGFKTHDDKLASLNVYLAKRNIEAAAANRAATEKGRPKQQPVETEAQRQIRIITGGVS